MKQKKHFTIDDRINLQAAIAKGLTWNETCKILHKHRTTIYRELLNYSIIKSRRCACSRCIKYEECRTNGSLCNPNDDCPMFVATRCPRLNHFPFVCNVCKKRGSCFEEKHYYDCIEAERNAQTIKVSSRSKRRITSNDLEYINRMVSPLILKGQSIHHIYVNVKSIQYICSERTIRRLVYDRCLDAKAFHLRRYVTFNHSKKRSESRLDNNINNVERLFQRTYTDYKHYVEMHPDDSIVQYDSVVGRINDAPAILTITFPKERFQFGRIIAKGNTLSVLRTLNKLFDELGDETVKKVFAINLSDNGTEFSGFHHLEKRGIKIFFTNPYCSNDKSACERNHEFIRYIIPKGKTLNGLTQHDVDLMFSHINSYVRQSNQNKTPFQLIEERFGSEFLNRIGIKKINPYDVLLKPELIKK